VGLRLHLVMECDFLAIAKATERTRERRHFSRFGRGAHEIRHYSQLANARSWHHLQSPRPEAANVETPSEVGGRVRAAAATSITAVGIVDGRLVGHDENVANDPELLRHGRNEVVADEDVLVLFLDDLVV